MPGQIMRSGSDCLKSIVFRRWQKIVSDGADVVSSGRVFQTRGPATEKTLLPTVESLTGGSSRLLELAECSVHRPRWIDGIFPQQRRKISQFINGKTERVMNTLQRSYKIYNFTSSVYPHCLIKLKPQKASHFEVCSRHNILLQRVSITLLCRALC